MWRGFKAPSAFCFSFLFFREMPPKNEDVVSSLMRAAAGSSAKDVNDEDLDSYIAELITKEAKEKRKKYDEIGVQAFQLET